jgi:signal transduction histidine kinase
MNSIARLFVSLNEKIIGSPDSKPLEQRIFTMITFYSILQCLMATVANLIAELDLFIILFPFCVSVFFAIFYYYSKRNKAEEKIVWSFILIALTTLVIIWINNGGYDSPNGYVYYLAMMLAIIIIGEKRRPIVLWLFVILFMALLIFSYSYPNLIVPYQSAKDRFMDLFFTTTYNMFLLYGIITYIMNNYQIERTKAENEKSKAIAAHQEILLKNIKISEQNSLLDHLNIQLLDKNHQITRHSKNLEELHEELTSNNYQISQQNLELETLNEQLVQTNLALDLLNTKLQEANSSKDKFFSIISHDLKNPLGAVRNYTDMLKFTDRLTPVQIEDISLSIGKSVDFVLDLLENLLSWSRSQTGNIEYVPEFIPFRTFIDNYKPNFDVIAKKKGITVSFENNNNHVVYADLNMLKTVVRNLFTNAVKFTDNGGRISIYSSEDDNKFVRITVSDTGTGISQDDLPKLFRIDAKHSTIGTSHEKGTGLGLILCKEFVEKNGGKIWADSEYGKGSSFSFTLPKG